MPQLNRLQVGLLLVLLLLCFIPAKAQFKRIGVIGSSTAACNGVDPNTQCWIGLVEHYYDSAGLTHNHDLIRLGITGTDCYQGMPSSYIPPSGRNNPDPLHNITQVVALGADIVIINFPSNMYYTFKNKEVMDCFRLMRDSVNKTGKVCYITTTQPRNDFDFRNQPARDSLIALRDSILNCFGAFAIDFWTDIANADGSIKAQYDQGDHTHLMPAAQKILFDRVIAKNMFASSAALPLFNLAFKNELKENKVLLSWKSDLASDAEFFYLQRSSDGINYANIYQAKAIAGNSYFYKDESPFEGNNFYRLMVTLKNGSTDFSPILKQSVKIKSFKIDRAYKNSAGLQIDFLSRTKQIYSASLINSIGATVFSTRFELNAGINHVQLHPNSLSDGTYFLRLQNNSGDIEVLPMLIRN